MAAGRVVKFPNFTPSPDLVRLIDAQNATNSSVWDEVNRDGGPEALKFLLRSQARQIKRLAHRFGADDDLKDALKPDLNQN